MSVHHWLRSAIRDSQQPTAPIGFLCLKLPPPTTDIYIYILFIYLFTYLFTYLYIHMFIRLNCTSWSPPSMYKLVHTLRSLPADILKNHRIRLSSPSYFNQSRYLLGATLNWIIFFR